MSRREWSVEALSTTIISNSKVLVWASMLETHGIVHSAEFQLTITTDRSIRLVETLSQSRVKVPFPQRVPEGSAHLSKWDRGLSEVVNRQKVPFGYVSKWMKPRACTTCKNDASHEGRPLFKFVEPCQEARDAELSCISIVAGAASRSRPQAWPVRTGGRPRY